MNLYDSNKLREATCLAIWVGQCSAINKEGPKKADWVTSEVLSIMSKNWNEEEQDHEVHYNHKQALFQAYLAGRVNQTKRKKDERVSKDSQEHR